MDRITSEILCKLTDDFYTANAESFSRTRQAPWAGWERVLQAARLVPAPADRVVPMSDNGAAPIPAGEEASPAGFKQGEGDSAPSSHSLEAGLFGNAEWPLTVLDVACGNMRFASYVRSQLPAEAQLEYFAVDNCDTMLPAEEELANIMPYARFEKVDLLQRLLHGGDLLGIVCAPPCQLVVSFGFMHHVPSQALRANLLDTLVRSAKPGGYVAVSFWQFMNSEELAATAREQHTQACAALQLDPACLEAGDYLLGWQDVPIGQVGSVRYCHSFSEAEIDELVASVANRAQLVDRFTADGRTGNLNTYIVLQCL